MITSGIVSMYTRQVLTGLLPNAHDSVNSAAPSGRPRWRRVGIMGPVTVNTTGAARVLIIEDDPNVAEVVARYLEREGYRRRDGRRRRRRASTGPSPIRPTWSCST